MGTTIEITLDREPPHGKSKSITSDGCAARRVTDDRSLTEAPSPAARSSLFNLTASQDLDPGMPAWRELVRHLVSRVKRREIHLRVLMDRQRTVAAVGRSDHSQLALPLGPGKARWS